MFVKFVGLTSDTGALVEHFRETASQTEDEIIQKSLRKLRELSRIFLQEDTVEPKDRSDETREIGCDLGKGAYLREGEKMFCFRKRSSLEARKPEGIAIGIKGKLLIDGQEVTPSRGSLVQPALQIIQRRLGDYSQTSGNLVSLDAWEYWYVERNGKYVCVGDLRDPKRIRRRNSHLKTGTVEPTPLSDF